MKKNGLFLLLLLVVFTIGLSFWLLSSSDPQSVKRETVHIPMDMPKGGPP